MKTLFFALIISFNFTTTTPDTGLSVNKDGITLANYNGGQALLQAFIAQNLKYPSYAREEAIEGTVEVAFHVLPDGRIYGAKVVKDLGYGCDEAALKMIESMPKWKPATQQGIAKASRVKLAVQFKLQ